MIFLGRRVTSAGLPRRVVAICLGIFWVGSFLAAAAHADRSQALLRRGLDTETGAVVTAAYGLLLFLECTLGVGYLALHRSLGFLRSGFVVSMGFLVSGTLMYDRLRGFECGCLPFLGIERYGLGNLAALGVVVVASWLLSCDAHPAAPTLGQGHRLNETASR